jgi:FKBP-type peptidyl-prolyl cis-trans isomerase (trigger factor)
LISGFRQGKIPLAMIISQYGGQKKFKIACLEGVMIKGFELAAMNKMVVQESLRVGLSQSKFAVLHVHNLHVNAFL